MEKLWTTSEVAQHLGISEAEVEQLVQGGRLTGYKLGGQFLRFRPHQVKQLRAVMEPRPQGPALATAEPKRWQERVHDFAYFYDFYIVSVILLAGLIVYLLSTG